MNTSFSPPNVLVVDDVKANLAVLMEILHYAGYIARPVTSARQAADAIEALIPDLILMDISMPEIDGFTFCSILKKHTKTREIPVIFVSALSSAEDRIKGFQAGAADYIVKPYEAEELMLRVKVQLQVHKKQQELETYNRRLNKIIHDQLRKIYEKQRNTLYALVILSAGNDSGKLEHLEHIGRNSRLLAMSLQLSLQYKDQITNMFIDAIELASQLCDIGKTIISDSLLQNPDRLRGEETELLKAHAEAGAAFLQKICSRDEQNELLKMAAEIANYHHENWDGSGYPAGLAGTEIPLPARIVSIIDVYTSLIGEAACKKACVHEKSMEIINQGAGMQFDPDIVAIFNKVQNQLVK
jgi:putative two-component system response regulator